MGNGADNGGQRAFGDGLFSPLGGPVPLTRLQAGGKAATLSELKQAGFPVPPGFVVTRQDLQARAAGAVSSWEDRLRASARACGPGPYAVRSSAAAEDLPGASYAGMYESYLRVAEGELAATVLRCFESANASRVRAYQDSLPRPENGAGAGPGPGLGGGHDAAQMAVLVQQMVDPAAAGVAFTAHPLTGARDEGVVSAVRGLGGNLVEGSEDGEEWLVREGRAVRRHGGAAALSNESATAVAAMARAVASHFGCPQDVEWAVDPSGQIMILQARPMTALPEPVVWKAPGKGAWLRNFRLGEWLPEPVTPLFMDWIIPLIDAGYNDAVYRSAGIRIPMGYATVNGWYYVAPPTPRALPHLLFGGQPRSLPYFFNSVLRPMIDPAGADRAVLRDLEHEWRVIGLPAYLALAHRDLSPSATFASLVATVEEIGEAAGRYLWFFSATGGAAWKMERVLAKFWRRHLAPSFTKRPAQGRVPEQALQGGSGYQVLLGGLLPRPPAPVPHAVYSLDWYHRTAGEEGPEAGGAGTTAHPGSAAPAAERRRSAEAACRDILRGTRRLRRFDELLAVAQHYALLREEQARDFTAGWPLLRRCARRIGRQLRDAGIITSEDDVFFLSRQDLRLDAPPQQERVAIRREKWSRQRKLAAPLVLGGVPLIGNTFDRIAHSARSTAALPRGALVGHPASPGRARGRVRVVRGPEDFPGFRPGEVLVAGATAPAWTPLFAGAAAVVTDSGNLAAHASLVAREYGIPAVVGTGNATQVLHTGQLVTVDGNAGTVEQHED
ncbi:hypothetical protein D7Z96_16400 [Pseudarthrobacter phenanthrenivorans]|uniref:Phosphoenolpyruvate synthase n=2 Tax=Pseudarthrobacter phenanthrenivorans TaxID=361575 RepID=A0A3B0F2X8_PSEPS|nr:PEP/pyruvate-binding domain-containing protein [Pseudarthrobacter phenanthrenivorans]ADX73132.1 phosphoenolpyruvate synthase/pyruvate phosphate dikinase [Pseudarthrobacter phenanthrenivorans Sphe3]RKO21296.1 hypothetical protein D7Z96_16400 [Pseudarthrobacter phenanthrenivorans]TPV53257.1 hypothetical protein FJ661_01310 [Pseudarthrobacter phenanthrenivorans]